MIEQIPDFSVCRRVLAGQWKLPILRALTEPLRFGDLQGALQLESRGILAAQLRELQEMNLIVQKKYPCFPPRVEYRLTEGGRSLCEILTPAQ